MILITLLQAIFGTSIPIGKKLLGFTSPIFLAGIRMFLAGVFLVAYSAVLQKKNINFKKAHIWPILQIMIFGIYLKYILRYWGLYYLTSAKMAFLLNSTPFVAAFFSYIFFKENLSKKKWIGLCLGFAGFIPMLLTSSPAEKLVGELVIFSWAELAIFAGVACHCYGMVIARRLIREENYPATMINGIRTFGGGFLALITSLILEGFAPADNILNNFNEFIFWLLALVLVSNIFCHNLYLHLLKNYSITFLSFTDFLGPIFTAFWGWFFLNEIITWHFYLSTVIVSIGLYIFYQDELTKEKENSEKLIIQAQAPQATITVPIIPIMAKERDKN